MNKYDEIDGKEILITGGCGTLGKEIVKQLKNEHRVKGIRIYSRDEHKHLKAKEYFKLHCQNDDNIAYIIGDIADYNQFKRSVKGVDVIIHAAALKQVPACEDNPIEAIRVNIIGAENVMMAAMENMIDQVVNIATDKGIYPVNLYGMTKAVAERLFIYGSVYTGGRKPWFKVCRYGNVIGSRGSVLPVWKAQVKTFGKITMTNRQMTRFFIPVSEVARFVISRITEKETGKIYVPFMKSISMGEFADFLYPDIPQVEYGIRPGEKIHETIITAEESIFTEKRQGYYVVNAYDMKINNVTKGNSVKGLVSYGLDSYGNPLKWEEEILQYCEVD